MPQAQYQPKDLVSTKRHGVALVLKAIDSNAFVIAFAPAGFDKLEFDLITIEDVIGPYHVPEPVRMLLELVKSWSSVGMRSLDEKVRDQIYKKGRE